MSKLEESNKLGVKGRKNKEENFIPEDVVSQR